MLAGNANQPSRRWPQAIAIVGLACRVPGAKTAGEFWQNLLAERDTLCELSESELRAAGVSAAQLRDPRYVRVTPLLDDYDCFDAALFRCSPREAAWMDPQHRVFLETAWEALEDAGYDPFRFPGATGLFAGAGGSVSSYLFAEAAKFADYLGGTASVPHLGNDKDFLPSRVSYKLNLRGPAVNVQTACSTSLVAVHFACQSLLSGESDMALAGGVCVRVPQRVGYLAREGDVVSPTGRCRPFSAAADGTVFGSGAGLVVLKTLDRALTDGDRIYAVIRGSAINNDGGDKLSYTASSVAGQIQCARAALAAAGVERATIGYVEAHGTATLLGDPLEVDALNQTYGDGKRHRCGIGSFKGNIGHLEAAAGVIGLIKTALALDQQVIPASIHCESPSPRIQFGAGPFHVVQHAQPWTRSAQPRRAAVNGLGVGGTNAHVVLEEVPLREALATITGEAVLCLSADRPEGLVELVRRYVDHFDAQPELNWHDVCFTAAAGRAILDHRLAVRARSLAEAREHLQRWLQEPPASCVLSTNAALTQIAARFVDDGQVSLDSVTPLGYRPRRVKLPSYPFARERHWIQSSSPVDNACPTTRAALLGEPRYSPATQETSFSAEFSLDDAAFLRHHRIYDRVIVPGATYLALLLTARGEHAGELTDIEFIRPLVLTEHERVRLQLSLVRREIGERFAVYSQSLNETDAGEWSEQVRATLSSVSGACIAPRLDDNSGEPLDPRQIYARFRELGLALDATFQTIHACRRTPEQLVAEIHAPLADHDSFWIHPAALDGCLQLVVGQLASPRDCLRELFLPLSIERLRWQRPPGTTFHCVVRPRADYAVASETRIADLVLYDEHGVCAQIDGLVVKRASRMSLERSSSDDLDGWLHAVSWEPVELQPAATMSAETWWLVGEQVTQIDGLQHELQSREQHVVVHDWATAGEQLQTSLDPTKTPQHIVLVTLSSQGVLPSPAVPTSNACAKLLNLIQGVCRIAGDLPRVWFVTRGAQAVQHDSLPLDTPAASHWGFARALAHEHPELHGTCLDLDPRSSASGWTVVVDELLAAGAERQVAYRGGQRYVARLQPLVDTLDSKVLASNAGQQRLQISARGSLDQLQLIAADARQPGPGEVRIDIDAAGLNFRDVLNTLGRYPGDPGELGMECAGRIRDLGPGVEGLVVGDRVVALAQGALATSVTVAAALVAKVPPSLTLPEAAAVPVVFATAEMGLRRLANLLRGERVLIHAAAGGVGWAASEIARSVGAEIYATASRDKWDYLRRQGITRLYDSRSLEFVEGVRRDTLGQGVHVVLNSLSGDFIPASLGLLAAGGRFVELGKQAIWTEAEVAAVRPDVRYHVLALDQRMIHEPRETGAVLRDVFAQLAAGTIRTPPLTCLPLQAAPRAMRRLQQGQQIGKCVLTCRSERQRAVRGDGSYVLVGGSGGLGQTVLDWLVNAGAKHIALVGRRAPSVTLSAMLVQYRHRGVEVQHFVADASDERQLREAFAQIRAGGRNLRGVFHLAGVLDDGLINRQDADRFERVWRPKVTAAWNLHQLTRPEALDHFVLFSSSTGVLGAAGQTNYAAANAALDALAAERVRQGLPAVSIAWGPWSGTGMAARMDDASRQRWQDRGVRFITPELGAALLDRIVRGDAAQAMAFRADWHRYRAQLPHDSLLADLGELTATASLSESHDSNHHTLAERIARVGQHELQSIVRAWLVEHVRHTLGWPESRDVDATTPLADQGLDSLMAVELLHQLRGELQPLMTVPPTMLFDHPLLDDLVAFLVPRLTPSRLAA